MTTGRTYTSALARLRTLPEVFTGSELTVLFGWTSGIASTYLAQWRKAGLVQSLGGRSDVHMNLVRNPQPDCEQALLRAHPQAVMVGLECLRRQGWTTQITAQPEVAVPIGTACKQLGGMALCTRTAAWFVKVAPGMQAAAHGLRSLRAAWALADMVQRAQDKRIRQAWLPDPEDLDWSLLQHPRQQPDSAAAQQALGLAEGCLERVGYARLYGIWATGACVLER